MDVAPAPGLGQRGCFFPPSVPEAAGALALGCKDSRWPHSGADVAPDIKNRDRGGSSGERLGLPCPGQRRKVPGRCRPAVQCDAETQSQLPSGAAGRPLKQERPGCPWQRLPTRRPVCLGGSQRPSSDSWLGAGGLRGHLPASLCYHANPCGSPGTGAGCLPSWDRSPFCQQLARLEAMLTPLGPPLSPPLAPCSGTSGIL